MSDPGEVAAAQWAGMRGELAFDVGAHWGENFWHLRRCGVKRIVAFEPEPDAFRQLQASLPGQDVTALCTAVAGRDGQLEMRRANGMLGNITGEERVTSGCVTLDSQAARFGRPDIVVVDVEGFEAQVLVGARALLAARRASWLVEFHSEPLFHLVTQAFTAAGYVPETVRHPHYPPDAELWLGHGWIRAVAS